jgi:proton-translocating NADH-quinone oxidoreductase chain M
MNKNLLLEGLESTSIFQISNLLPALILLPLLGAVILLLVPSRNTDFIKKFGLATSFFTFFLSLFLWLFFDCNCVRFQFVYDFVWISPANLNFSFGVDGISVFFVLLTTLLIPLCLLGSWNSTVKLHKEYAIAFLSMEAFLIFVFTVRDLLLFYVFFESVLIPMFIIIGVWGSRERKIRASYLFFFYTLLGSVLMLLSILYIYFEVGSTDYETLLLHPFTFYEQRFIWLAFFASFASKVPMLPFHIWLPEAHVEAPTSGSVVLAGILLKLGSYGFLRFSLPLLPEASLYFTPLIFSLSILGVVYTSLTAIRQTDLKRVIAYTSVAHMNLVMLGLFSFNVVGLEGAILQSLSHGFVSSALFLIIGVVYDRHHTKMIKYYSGLVHLMPIFTTFFLIFTMANIALPGTSSFVGEFLILSGIFKMNTSAAFFGALGMILGGGYSLWLFNRVVYGNLKIQYLSNFQDLNLREFFIFLPLLSGTFVMGIYPEIFLVLIHGSVQNLISQIV